MRYYLFFKRNEILICANMDESWQHYVKWKEPDKTTKEELSESGERVQGNDLKDDQRNQEKNRWTKQEVRSF